MRQHFTQFIIEWDDSFTLMFRLTGGDNDGIVLNM
jgi:hypothetical protein